MFLALIPYYSPYWGTVGLNIDRCITCAGISFLLQNHRAERHWVEVNSRVNFPLKRALTNMQHHNLIDMDCPVTKYCVSVMTGKLAQVGIQTHISSWNHHRIPGMCIT